nr:alpha-rhamnosidase [Rikenellaceae bacterium]
DLIPWFYRDLAGINPLAPAYKRIRLEPDLSIQDLKEVSARYESLHGTIESSYRKQGNRLEWTVEIPCNTEAVIALPTLNKQAIKHAGIRYLESKDGYTLWQVPSGRYSFKVALK